MEAQALIQYMLNNVLTMVIFFVCLLTYILINSLTQTDVEERRYEFGVLRTLGLKNKNLIILISIQTLIFSLPGILGGLLAMTGLLQLTQIAFSRLAMLNIEVIITSYTIKLGFAMGLLIPFISNVIPVRQALGQTLKNALDKHRPSLDDLEVEMIRLEHQGISPTKVTVSLILISFGILNVYYIPEAIVYKRLQYFLHLVNNELLILILGLTFLA